MQTYVVEKGDTLFGISKQFGVSVEELKRINDLVNNNIQIGELLRIPTEQTSSLYIVKRGDTLYSIASRYGISVDELIRVNNLNSYNLGIGQQLVIPINSSNSDDYVIYTVKVGDTLYSIARSYNTTVDELIKFNNLSTSNLSIGQKLKVPRKTTEEDSQYMTYVVQSGESLYSIARKFGMSVIQLMSINKLESTNLSVGQVLKVIGGNGGNNGIPLGSSCYGEGYSEIEYVTYIVRRGDNLYTIAKNFGVSVESIRELNNLVNNNLSIGQVLKIKEVL